MRHFLLSNVLFVFLLHFLFPLNSFTEEKKFFVTIDPGHGGSDSGAIQNQIKESELVLKISKNVASLLEKNYPEINVRLTRHENKYVALDDRIKTDKDVVETDLFVSLHANSSISSFVQGMEVYFQPDQIKKSKSVLQTITADLESMGKTKNSLLFSKHLQSSWNLSPSVIRRSSFFVVEKSDYPSVLVELGFLSNPKEAEKLNTATYQSSIAETIVKSIVEYKNSIQ